LPVPAPTGGTDIKADPAIQLRLLDLQTIDSAIAQLEHRRRTLAEHADLARHQAERAKLASELVAADTRVLDLEDDQTKAEADLEPVRQRLVRDEKRIADGSVSDAKALSGLVDEVTHLRRRIGDLEDAELEIMEALEAAEADRSKLRGQAEHVDAQIETTTRARDTQLEKIGGELAEQQTERSSVAAELPTDLLGLYVKIATGHGGVGAAELRRRRCTGCQLEINAADLRQFAAAPADEVLRCEECSRILIRTAESGL
jgi:predicted  nucleic acid-binding Zn-ribbon protein